MESPIFAADGKSYRLRSYVCTVKSANIASIIATNVQTNIRTLQSLIAAFGTTVISTLVRAIPPPIARPLSQQ